MPTVPPTEMPTEPSSNYPRLPIRRYAGTYVSEIVGVDLLGRSRRFLATGLFRRRFLGEHWFFFTIR